MFVLVRLFIVEFLFVVINMMLVFIDFVLFVNNFKCFVEFELEIIINILFDLIVGVVDFLIICVCLLSWFKCIVKLFVMNFECFLLVINICLVCSILDVKVENLFVLICDKVIFNLFRINW